MDPGSLESNRNEELVADIFAQEGEFMGIPPTHKQVQFSGIVIHRIEYGKFAESRNEIDLLGIRQQLTYE